MGNSCDILYLLDRHPRELYHGFAEFQRISESKGINISFVLFDNSEVDKIDDIIDYYVSPEPPVKANIREEARRLESRYNFTFHHVTRPELVQTHEYRPNESDVNNIKDKIIDTMYLEYLVDQLNPKLILRGQGTKTTNYFADRLAKQKEIKQATSFYDFIGRMVFFKTIYGNTANLHDVIFNPNWSKRDTEQQIQDYIESSINPAHSNRNPVTFWKGQIEKLVRNPRKLTIVPSFIQRLADKKFEKFTNATENRLKQPLYYTPNYSESYLFHPLHLPTESTNVFRNHPYSNQQPFVRYLSRNLPYETDLYVREHPNHPEQFSWTFLRRLSNIPNVRVISPKIDVHKIIEHSTGVIVNNNTTGYEAIMQNKPVVAFSPSPYDSHESVFFVDTPYQADEKISTAINCKVDSDKNIKFLTFMFRRSVDISLRPLTLANKSEGQKFGSRFAEAVHKLFYHI